MNRDTAPLASSCLGVKLPPRPEQPSQEGLGPDTAQSPISSSAPRDLRAPSPKALRSVLMSQAVRFPEKRQLLG